MEGVIETMAISKRYRRTWALREVDLAVAAGGVTALVGPNGAGKSTLLKLCIGFERPTAGRMSVMGKDPARDRAATVAAIGYVPQAPNLYRELSVADHVDLARTLRAGFDGAYARERLRALAIPLAARPTELSGGQQAQVALAIALGTRAPLLLLDEPLANLDPLARRELLAVVDEAVRAGGITAVLSSHVIVDVEPIADRLLVLGDGRVLFHDTVAAAIAGHRVVEGSVAPFGTTDVAAFPDRNGDLHRLVIGDAIGRRPTLEEVVIGYLSSARHAPHAIAGLRAAGVVA